MLFVEAGWLRSRSAIEEKPLKTRLGRLTLSGIRDPRPWSAPGSLCVELGGEQYYATLRSNGQLSAALGRKLAQHSGVRRTKKLETPRAPCPILRQHSLFDCCAKSLQPTFPLAQRGVLEVIESACYSLRVFSPARLPHPGSPAALCVRVFARQHDLRCLAILLGALLTARSRSRGAQRESTSM